MFCGCRFIHAFILHYNSSVVNICFLDSVGFLYDSTLYYPASFYLGGTSLILAGLTHFPTLRMFNKRITSEDFVDDVIITPDDAGLHETVV